MSRPEPRMSALSSSPVVPRSTHTGNAGKDRTYAKLTVRVPEEVLEEARAAFWSTSAQTSTRSLSAWVVDAIEAKLDHNRNAFNGGRRFTPVPAGEIPTGRRS
ncbi:hypothetical protein [Schaalia cardiffensis]|uniref:hypothetical protein n=1 Tax=Schaalia cardiffensis TaxID=181487 RepID=UPI0023F4EEAE|nr:hypothetical protein [Schaalia cardiffensis]